MLYCLIRLKRRLIRRKVIRLLLFPLFQFPGVVECRCYSVQSVGTIVGALDLQERRSQQQFLPLIRQQEEQEQNLMQMHLNQWQEFEQWTQQQWQLMEQQQEQARERGQVQRLAQRRQPESREIEQHCRAAPHDRQHGKSSWHGKQSVLPNEDGKDDPSQRQTLRELQKRKESVIVSSSLANRLLEKTRGDP